MANRQYSGDTDYISRLPDKPVTDGPYTAATFKAVFDRFGTEFVAWFNSTFQSALNSTFQAVIDTDNKLNGANITNGTVDTDQLHANAVTNDKLASNAVRTAHIKNGEVTYAKLNADAKPATGRKMANSTDWAYDTEVGYESYFALTLDYTGIVEFTASDNIIVSPRATTEAFQRWRDNGVHVVNQGTNTIKLRAETKPTGNFNVDVLVVR